MKCRRMVTLARKGLVTLGAVLFPLSALAADLVAYTNEWPPYNYQENGKVRGVATDVLRAVCAEAKLSCDFQLVPWARAYATVQSTPNTVAFTMARIPERETLFQWVGPVFPRVTWVYGAPALKDRVKTFNDLSAYRIGVVRGEASVRDLEAKGISPAELVVDNSDTALLRQLSKGWVQAMVNTELGMAWELSQNGLPANTVVKLLKLTDKGGYYFAFNPQTDPAVLARVHSAFERVRKAGGIRRVISDYGYPPDS